MADKELERGKASIVISLDNGMILVKHGEAGILLAHLNEAPLGTWDKIWDNLKALGFEVLTA